MVALGSELLATPSVPSGARSPKTMDLDELMGLGKEGVAEKVRQVNPFTVPFDNTA